MVTVRIRYKGLKNETFCSGIVLSKTRILTAASCLPSKFDKTKHDIFIIRISHYDGIFKYNEEEYGYPAKDFIVHEDFGVTGIGRRFVNNLALIEATGISQSAGKIIYKTLEEGDADVRYWEEYAPGYKAINMFYGGYIIISKNECKDRLFIQLGEELPEGMLCTMYPSDELSEYSCRNTGALIVDKNQEYIFVGLASFNMDLNEKGRCNVKVPMLFTDLFYYKPWIKKNVPDLNQEWN